MYVVYFLGPSIKKANLGTQTGYTNNMYQHELSDLEYEVPFHSSESYILIPGTEKL